MEPCHRLLRRRRRSGHYQVAGDARRGVCGLEELPGSDWRFRWAPHTGKGTGLPRGAVFQVRASAPYRLTILCPSCIKSLKFNGKNFNRRNSANVHHHSAVAVKTDRLRHQKPSLEVAPTTKNSTIKQQACSPTQQLRCRCRHLVKSTKHNAVLDSKNEYPVSSCGHWPAISLFELVLGKP